LRRIASEGPATWFELAVRDTGVGIPEEAQSRLFEAFAQADSSTSRRYGGTGLGLPICQRLAALMGGRIGFESELGRGSRFYLRVAFELGAAVPDEPPPPSLCGLAALVIERHGPTAESLRRHLARCGLTADGAADAAAALPAWRSGKYDVVLLEVGLEFDGQSLAARAISDPSLAGPRLILMGRPWQRSTAVPQQADWLTKPARLTRVRECLLREDAEARPARRQLRVAGRAPRILLVEDNAVNQLVACQI